MTKLTEINQAAIDAWPSSGTATTVTTGLNSLTGTVTHHEDTSVSEGELGRKYIEFAEGVAGTFRISPTSEPFVGDSDYYIVFGFRAKKTGTPADGGFNQFQRINGTGGQIWLKIWTYDDGSSQNRNGLGVEDEGNGFTGTQHALGDMNGTTFSPAAIAYDDWGVVIIHMKDDSVNGVHEFIYNGDVLAATEGNDFSLISLANKQDFKVELPAKGGVAWQITGPFETWNGSDIVIRPDHSKVPENSDTTKIFHHHWSPASSDPKGRFFNISGTATITGDSYYSGTHRRRARATGTAGQTMNVDTIDDVGMLPYNPQGWASIVLSDFYLPDGTTMDLSIRNVDDTGDVVSLSVDSSRNLKQGTTTLQTLSNTARYSLVLHLKSDGQAAYTLVDITNSFASVQTVFSGILANWTVQSIGKIKSAIVLGDTAADYGEIDICRWVNTNLVDSQVVSTSGSVTPSIRFVNRTGSQLPNNQDQWCVPGGWYRKKELLAENGKGRNMTNVLMGYAGVGYTPFITRNVDTGGMDHCHGLKISFIDGYSTHETSGLMTTETQRDTVVATASTHIQKFIDKLIPNDNMLVLGTMHRRNYTTPPEFEHQGVNMINEMIREKAIANQTEDNLIQLADYAKYTGTHEDQFPADDVHYDSDGSVNIADILFSKVETPKVGQTAKNNSSFRKVVDGEVRFVKVN